MKQFPEYCMTMIKIFLITFTPVESSNIIVAYQYLRDCSIVGMV